MKNEHGIFFAQNQAVGAHLGRTGAKSACCNSTRSTPLETILNTRCFVKRVHLTALELNCCCTRSVPLLPAFTYPVIFERQQNIISSPPVARRSGMAVVTNVRTPGGAQRCGNSAVADMIFLARGDRNFLTAHPFNEKRARFSLDDFTSLPCILCPYARLLLHLLPRFDDAENEIQCPQVMVTSHTRSMSQVFWGAEHAKDSDGGNTRASAEMQENLTRLETENAR